MEELFKKMQNIVNRYVKHYKEDFEQDKKYIREMLDENLDTPYERHLFWIVRECGTNLGYQSQIADSATYSYYLSAVEDYGKNHRYYEIDLEKQTVKLIKNPKEYKTSLLK